MPRTQKILQHFKGTTCHIFNRGVQKDKIFLEDEDYIFYLKRIRKYKEMYGIEFLNYNLLPNHFHYTIRQIEDNSYTQCHLPPQANGTEEKEQISSAICLGEQMALGKQIKTNRTPISKFMHVLHNSYAHYFNKKYKRSGHVFQDRYKQRIIEDDSYLF